MKKNIGTILLLFFTCLAFGQKKLAPEDLQRLQKNAEKNVVAFEKLVADIAIGRDTAKQIFISTVYAMFEPKATIEVSSKKENTVTKNQYPILKYLNNLAKLTRKYKIITMTFKAGFVETEKLKEKKDEQGNIFYEGSITIKQCFCASNSLTINNNDVELRKFTTDCSAYGDCTTKKVKIVAKQVLTIEGERWIVMLGDISVVETNSIK